MALASKKTKLQYRLVTKFLMWRMIKNGNKKQDAKKWENEVYEITAPLAFLKYFILFSSLNCFKCVMQ